MKDFLSIVEVAERCKVSEITVRSAVLAGHFPKAFKVGRKWFIPVWDADTYWERWKLRSEGKMRCMRCKQIKPIKAFKRNGRYRRHECLECLQALRSSPEYLQKRRDRYKAKRAGKGASGAN